ncbi:MAG: tetratricopeptide repeat protein [Anaerolineales bacterium]|jgi:tetratricopeptide (TPR) repeat protein
MADDEEFFSPDSGEDTMLRQAIEALRTGDRARARDLLTRLLKADQKNVEYWVWLSAVVETSKERLYCLKTAIQLDPQNAAAKRGLILLGALPPDDSVPPFPVNRPRRWEQQLASSREAQEKLVGWENPLTRVFIILGIAVVVIGLVFGGSLLLQKKASPAIPIIPTPPSTETRTPIPTSTVPPNLRSATPTFLGQTPLWRFLDKTYTPTPLYVITVHPVTSNSAFEAGLRFLAAKDYKNSLALFQQVETLEPSAPDIYYYIGEIYSAQGNFRAALDQYQKAINKDANFAPAFLGRALANLALNPKADVSNDLNGAISIDPHYTDAYIQRGKYLLSSNPSAAEADFRAAVENSPDSALAYLYLADAQLALGEYDVGLASAQRANQIDLTLVPVYLALARGYIATGQSDQAVSVLQTYTIYAPNDTSAYLVLGEAYNAAGQYQMAVNTLNKAVDANRRDSDAYTQRGYAYFNLQEASLAVTDFRSATAYNPSDFDAQLGLARALDLQKKPGDAYIQIEQKVSPLAKTDATKAQVYYYEAVFLEEIGDKLSLQGADNAWNKLIALPADVMPIEWRMQAYQYLNITPTYTPTLIPTIIPKYTSTTTPIFTEPSAFTPTPYPTEMSTPTVTP